MSDDQTMSARRWQPSAVGNRAALSKGSGGAAKMSGMKKGVIATLLTAAALVVALIGAVRAGALPLGVRGEWEWLRVPYPASALDLMLAGVAVAAYAAGAAWGMKCLRGAPSRVREGCAVVGLLAGAIALQLLVPSGAPVGYGLAKWAIVLNEKGSTGYFQVAKHEAGDLPRFLAAYPDWVRRGDALHLGTHPPGLIAVEAVLLRGAEELADVNTLRVGSCAGIGGTGVPRVCRRGRPVPRG